MKQRLEASVAAEDGLQQQVLAQQRQVEDANQHCEALSKARQEAEDELQEAMQMAQVRPCQPALCSCTCALKKNQENPVLQEVQHMLQLASRINVAHCSLPN